MVACAEAEEIPQVEVNFVVLVMPWSLVWVLFQNSLLLFQLLVFQHPFQFVFLFQLLVFQHPFQLVQLI